MRENLIPAYGRDYRSAKAVREAFASGEDFRVANAFSRFDGKPANIEDLRRAGVRSVTIRYGNLAKVCMLQVPSASTS